MVAKTEKWIQESCLVFQDAYSENWRGARKQREKVKEHFALLYILGEVGVV